MARPKSDIQHRIVVAARERFVTEGVDGASLRTIAADAGTSVGMIYYYFKTKDDLFLAVVEDAYGALIHDLEAAMSEGRGAPDKLRRAFVRIGHMSVLELTTMRLVLREALGSTARLERLIPRFMTGHIGLLLGTVAEGVGAGALRDDMPAPILMMTAVAMGVAPQIARRVAGDRIPIGAIDTEPLADLSVRLWMEGAGRRKTRRSLKERRR